MNITDLKIGEKATITKVKASEPIKGRLYAMGITKGNTIRLLDHTLKKQTWEVDVEGTRVALRDEEARAVEVER